MGVPVAFLDRDGTINVDHGYVCQVRDWQYTERAIEGLQILAAGGFRLAVVTNQSGIARGYYRLADVLVLHDFLRQQLREVGITLDAVALCPHDDQAGCDCRKPRPGLSRQVERQLGDQIDYRRSWTIGDKVSDLEFGQGLGTRTALIRSPYWRVADVHRPPDRIVRSLYDAACQIVPHA